MLFLELLSRLLNSNISLPFWSLFTGLTFLNKLNTRLSLSQNSHSATVSLCPYYDHIQPPRGHNTRFLPYVTPIKQSLSLKVTHHSFRHASAHLWNQLPTSLTIPYPNYLSLSATFIWTYRFNLLHTAITFNHFSKVPIWAQDLPFQQFLSSTIVCFFYRTDLLALDLLPDFFCLSVLCLNFISIWY